MFRSVLWQSPIASQSAVTILLLALAAPILGAAVRHGFEKGFRTAKAVIGIAVGLSLLLAGVFWSGLRRILDPQLVESFRRVATDARTWLVLIGAFWLYLSATSTILLFQRRRRDQETDRELRELQYMMARFAAPRRLSPVQIKTIQEHLSKFPPHSLRVVVHKNDDEAKLFADDLLGAIMGANWSVRSSAYAYEADMQQGLKIHFEMAEHPGPSRVQRNPMPDLLLEEALKLAGVRVRSRGRATQKSGEDMMHLEIGPRPVDAWED